MSAFLGGVVFNAANILLVAAIAIAGMSVAFPVGIGLALVLGVLINYVAKPTGNPVLLFVGVASDRRRHCPGRDGLSPAPRPRIRGRGQGARSVRVVRRLDVAVLLPRRPVHGRGGDAKRLVERDRGEPEVGIAASRQADFLHRQRTVFAGHRAQQLPLQYSGHVQAFSGRAGGAVTIPPRKRRGASLGRVGGLYLGRGNGLEPDCLQRGWLCDFVRPRPGRHLGGRHLGRLHLEGVPPRAARNQSAHLAHVCRLHPRFGIRDHGEACESLPDLPCGAVSTAPPPENKALVE